MSIGSCCFLSHAATHVFSNKHVFDMTKTIDYTIHVHSCSRTRTHTTNNLCTYTPHIIFVLEKDTKAAVAVAITPRPLIRNASLLKCNDWYSDNTPRTPLLHSCTPRKDPSHCVFEQLLCGAIADKVHWK